MPGMLAASTAMTVAWMTPETMTKSTSASRARPRDRSWWSEQTLTNPEVSERAWRRVWEALELPLPEMPAPLHFSSYAAALESSYAAALEVACAGHASSWRPCLLRNPS
jgi:hypothetical protein